MQDLVKVYEYELNEAIIHKCIEENRELTNKDVEMEIHEILRDNWIPYKNKIIEGWIVDTKYHNRYNLGNCNEYNLIVEIYVDKVNQKLAEELIDTYINGGK